MNLRARLVRYVPKGTCACKMIAGDARRIAQGAYLVGYYLSCPACGMVNVLLSDEVELQELAGELVGIGGHSCSRCSTLFRLKDRAFEVDLARAG